MVEVQGISTHCFDLSSEAVVRRKDDGFGAQLCDGGIGEAEGIELVSVDEFVCGAVDLDSAADEVFQCVDQCSSLPGWGLIEEVAGFREDVRGGHELPVGLEKFLKPFNILVCELLNPFELLQEGCICSRNEPEQKEIGIKHDLVEIPIQNRLELNNPLRAPRNSPSSARSFTVLYSRIPPNAPTRLDCM